MDTFKIILPLILLVFWALSQILGREVRQPPRPVPRGLPGGGPPREPLQSLWPPEPARGPANKAPDILILDEPARRPRSAAAASLERSAPSVRPRRAARKAAQAPAVTSVPERSLARIELAPLTAPSEPATKKEATVGDFTDTMATAVREGLQSPQRVREALVLSEVLQPPLALRGRTLHRH